MNACHVCPQPEHARAARIEVGGDHQHRKRHPHQRNRGEDRPRASATEREHLHIAPLGADDWEWARERERRIMVTTPHERSLTLPSPPSNGDMYSTRSTMPSSGAPRPAKPPSRRSPAAHLAASPRSRGCSHPHNAARSGSPAASVRSRIERLAHERAGDVLTPYRYDVTTESPEFTFVHLGIPELDEHVPLS